MVPRKIAEPVRSVTPCKALRWGSGEAWYQIRLDHILLDAFPVMGCRGVPLLLVIYARASLITRARDSNSGQLVSF